MQPLATEYYAGQLISKVSYCSQDQKLHYVKQQRFESLQRIAKKIFLPQGYPHSVSKDYMEYQVWDTIQAIASSVTGALAGQALLIGVGVGDAKATIFAASLSWMLKDGCGMIGRIAFTGWQGSNLDSDCKRWRFVADILNDFALLLELLSPFVIGFFTPLVCVANLLKSLVGVAGGATRAAVTQHQALCDNVADVAAKDSSQETMSNLVALLFNFMFVYVVTGNWSLIFFCFLVLTGVHLYANYKAVRCLEFTTFNHARLHLCLSKWLPEQLDLLKTAPNCNLLNSVFRGQCYKPFPSVGQINQQEPILGWADTHNSISLGCSLGSLPGVAASSLPKMIKVFETENYLLYCSDWKTCITTDKVTSAQALHIYILLMPGTTASDLLKAMIHAELLIKLDSLPHSLVRTELSQAQQTDDEVAFYESTLALTGWIFEEFCNAICSAPSPRWSLKHGQFDAGDRRVLWRTK